MIDQLTEDIIRKEVADYQDSHKEIAIKALKRFGNLIPPILTVLVYNTEEKDFTYLILPVDPNFFSSKPAKEFFINHVVPENLERMVEQHLIPTALSMSMEATMKMGDKNSSIEDVMENGTPVDVLMHSFETLNGTTVELYKMEKTDTQVVNEDGDVINDYNLELLDVGKGETPQVEGIFANILMRFQDSLK